MPSVSLNSLRKELAKARWREKSLLGIVSVANVSQQSAPFDSITLNVIKEKNMFEEPFRVGYSMFLVSGITALTEEARQSGCTQLLPALRWATQRSNSMSYIRVNESFTTRFMTAAKETAIQSPAACAVLLGVTVEEAHEIAKTSTDRMTLAEFAQHFDIRLRLRGDDRGIDDAFWEPQRVLRAFLKAPDIRDQRRERQRLLRTMFATRALCAGSLSEMASAQILQDLRDLEHLFTELSLGEAVMRRLFLLLPIESADAHRLALRLRRQMNRAVDGRSAVHRAPPQGEVKESLLHQIQGTVLDALCCRFTATDLILVFFVAVLVSVRAQNIDVVNGHEAFWITWAEKRLSKFLQGLIVGDTARTNAEGTKPSPQQITY